jgi:hypothetical protein
MDITPESLAEKFRLYSDEELLELFRSGDLTELAQTVARTELASRGIDPGPAAPPPEVEAEPVVEGDLVMVARIYDPLEAEMRQHRRRPAHGESVRRGPVLREPVLRLGRGAR